MVLLQIKGVVDEVEGFFGAGDGGVHPAVFLFGGVETDVAHGVEVDMRPFAALGFVAGDGVAVGAAECVEVGVGSKVFFESLFVLFGCDALLFHAFAEVDEECALLFGVEVKGVGVEGVEQDEEGEFSVAEGFFDVNL